MFMFWICVAAAISGMALPYVVSGLVRLAELPAIIRQRRRVAWFRIRLASARMIRQELQERFARGLCYRGYRLVRIKERMRWYAVSFDGIRFQPVAERCTIHGIMSWCDEHQEEYVPMHRGA